MIQLERLSKSYGGQTLFDELDWFIPEGERIGLVGPNGAGKTTLFRIIVGQESCDGGRVVLHGKRRIGYLPQEIDVHSSRSVLDEVIEGRAEVLDAERQVERLRQDLEDTPDGPRHEALALRFAEAEARYAMLGGYTLRPDAERILSGMGFSNEAMRRPLDTFSGGWQMRALLSRLLLAAPDLLLLDEPTNHLDLPSVEWLESFLRTYPGTVILISHDRYFLNRMVTRIAELTPRGVNVYVGNWDDYIEGRAERLEQQQKAAAQQQRQIAHLEAFVERFRAKATKAKQAQSRLKQLEKIDRIEVDPGNTRHIAFRFAQPPRSGRDVLDLRHARKAYGSNVVYSDISFRVERGEKIALVGPNGAGKTTLFKMIAGVERLDAGELLVGHNVTISYFAQHAVDALDLNHTVLEAMMSNVSDEAAPRVRGILGAFLFSGDAVNKKVRVLSGGEKNRLALARMLLEPRNLLLLDEPTNHLDVQSCDVLEDAIQSFEGTVCFISHDRHFINAVANRVVHVEDGRLDDYQGDYEYYRWKRDQDAAAALQSDGAAAATTGSRKDSKRRKHELRQQKSAEMGDLKKRFDAAEEAIARAEKEKAAILASLSDPAIYNDGGKVRDLNKRSAQLDDTLEELFLTWEELGSQIQSIEARYAELEREEGL